MIEIGEDTGAGTVYQPSSLYRYSTDWVSPTSLDLATTISSFDATVSTSSTVAVRLTMSGRTIASDNFAAGSAISSLDATDRMRFPVTGPGFTLPAGFTADSVDANIVDNQIAQSAAAPVPLMSGQAIALLAMLLAASGSRSSVHRVALI